MGLKEEIEKRRKVDQISATKQAERELIERQTAELMKKQEYEQSSMLFDRVVAPLLQDFCSAYAIAKGCPTTSHPGDFSFRNAVTIGGPGEDAFNVHVVINTVAIRLEVLRYDPIKNTNAFNEYSRVMILDKKHDEDITRELSERLLEASAVIDAGRLRNKHQ
jgi:hypothetical protein